MTAVATRLLVLLFATLALATWAAGIISLDPRRVAGKTAREAHRIVESRTKWTDARAEKTLPQLLQAQQERGFVVFQRSTLERVTAHSTPAEKEIPGVIHLEAAWDEYEPAQLAVQALRNLSDVALSASDLSDGHGHSLAAAAIDIRMVRFYALHLSVRASYGLGVVPKTLEPAAPIAVPAGSTRPYWITVHVPDGQPGGLYRGTITVREKDAHTDVPLEIEVLPRRLDEPDAMLGPWSVPVLRNYPNAQGREADHIRERAELVFRDIREHGMTTIGLWSGTVARQKDGHVVLPDLDAALELYHKYRFPQPLFYAPVNLLSTNKLKSSANYKHYDPDVHVELAAAITREYTRRAREAGIPGIVFAPVEEPNLADGIAPTDAPETRQRIATQLLKAIKGAGGMTAMTCTPDSARVGEGNLDYWLVAYKKFLPSVFAQVDKAKAHRGLYANATLMGNGTYFSRFFFGYYPWAMQLKVTAAWTYPLLPKRFPENLGGQGEGGLHVTDGWLGSDGKPIPVIQWELARQGINDFRYLVTLAHLAERASHASDSRTRHAADEASAFLTSLRASISPDAHRYTFEDPQTFEPVPAAGWDTARFESTRRKSFELVKTLSSLVDRPADSK